ncbi:MAG: hypothetical protein IJZ95_04625 [Oscillospiraceae bacterium]|nr:hypothetical protein [Oscillospiraceae bacterium]
MKLNKLFALASAAAVTLAMAGCSDKVIYTEFQQGNRYSFPAMETENGFYSGGAWTSWLNVRYYDKETGKCIYLCNRPECTHDGKDDFCTATNYRIIKTSMVMSGNYIYFSGYKTSEDYKEHSYGVWRLALDGTELTQICSFQNVKNSGGHANFDDYMIVHKNYAVVPFADYSVQTLTEDAVMNTLIVDLKTGQYKQLPAEGYTLTDIQGGQGEYCAEGDWLYYVVEPKDYLLTKHLYRYNFVTGETERLEDVPGRITDFEVIDGKIYYTKPFLNDTPSQLCVYDIETKQTTDLSQELMFDGDTLTNAQMITDGQYMYIHDSPLYYLGKDYHPKHPDRCLVTDMQGKVLADFTLPEEYNIHLIEPMVSDGKLYLYLNERYGGDSEIMDSINSNAICCPVEDILAGNIKWTEPYYFGMEMEFYKEDEY